MPAGESEASGSDSPRAGSAESASDLYSAGATTSSSGRPELDGVLPPYSHLRRLWPSVQTAIPDFRAELQQQLVDGGRVATLWIFSGTHQGPLFGIPGSGKPVRFQNVSIARVENGKVVEYNSETGWLDFLMQIGVLPLK